VSIFQSRSSSILLLLDLFQRRVGSEEVESLVGSEAQDERGTRRGRRKAEEAWGGGDPNLSNKKRIKKKYRIKKINKSKLSLVILNKILHNPDGI
jgi:hypothetical protein